MAAPSSRALHFGAALNSPSMSATRISATITMMGTTTAKIIENHLGKAFINQMARFVMNPAGTPVGAPPPELQQIFPGLPPPAPNSPQQDRSKNKSRNHRH
jgi:hypothetical protein